MRKVYFLLAVLFAFSGNAQTKLISFKSHSGNLKNFRTAIENNLFDTGASNFGLPSHYTHTEMKLDTVIYFKSDRVILVKSIHAIEEFPKTKAPSKVLPSQIVRDTIADPLFLRRHSLDSIKGILAKHEGIANKDVNEVVFIGYDNNKKLYKKEKRKVSKKKALKSATPVKKNIITVLPSSDDHFPSKTIMVAVLIFLSLLTAFFCWKLNRFKSVAA